MKLSDSNDDKITLNYLCTNFDLSQSEQKIVKKLKDIKFDITYIRNFALLREREVIFKDFEFYLLVSQIKCDITLKKYRNGIRYYFVLNYFENYRYHLSDLYPQDSEVSRISACEDLYDIFELKKPTRARYSKQETEKIQKLLKTHYSLRLSLIEHLWKRKAKGEYCIRFCVSKEGKIVSEYIELSVKGQVFKSENYPHGFLKDSTDFYKQALNDLYCQSLPLFAF